MGKCSIAYISFLFCNVSPQTQWPKSTLVDLVLSNSGGQRSKSQHGQGWFLFEASRGDGTSRPIQLPGTTGFPDPVAAPSLFKAQPFSLCYPRFIVAFCLVLKSPCFPFIKTLDDLQDLPRWPSIISPAQGLVSSCLQNLSGHRRVNSCVPGIRIWISLENTIQSTTEVVSRTSWCCACGAALRMSYSTCCSVV